MPTLNDFSKNILKYYYTLPSNQRTELPSEWTASQWQGLTVPSWLPYESWRELPSPSPLEYSVISDPVATTDRLGTIGINNTLNTDTSKLSDYAYKVKPTFGQKVNFIAKNNPAVNAAIQAAGQIGGSLASKAISDGLHSTAGDVVGTVGGIAGSVIGSSFGPLGSAAGSFLGQSLGGVTNRLVGYKTNDENIAKVKGNIAMQKAVGNQLQTVNDTSTLVNAYGSISPLHFSRGDLGRDGLLSHKIRNMERLFHNRQNYGTALMNHGLETGEKRADSMQEELTKKYNTISYADGGLLGYSTGMPAVDYDFMNGYLTMRNNQNLNKGKVISPVVFALGGDVQTHGADFSTGSRHINAGGTHEENPNEGVQMGVDRQGTPNLVEEGEVVYNDYVYSKRIYLDDEAKEKFHISKKREISYADMAKKLEKEVSERPNDPISKAGYKAQMEALAEEQERQKAEMQAKEAQEMFAQLSPEEQVALIQQLQGQQQEAYDQQAQEAAMQEQAMAEQQDMSQEQITPEMIQQEAMSQMPQESPRVVAAYGGRLGNRFDGGGPFDWDAFFNLMKNYTASRRAGRGEGTYAIDPSFSYLNGYKTIKELENSQNYKDWTQKVYNLMRDTNVERKVQDKYDDRDLDLVLTYLNLLQNGTPRSSRVNFYDYSDKNGDRYWKFREGAAELFKQLREDGKGGIMHFTPQLQEAMEAAAAAQPSTEAVLAQPTASTSKINIVDFLKSIGYKTVSDAEKAGWKPSDFGDYKSWEDIKSDSKTSDNFKWRPEFNSRFASPEAKAALSLGWNPLLGPVPRRWYEGDAGNDVGWTQSYGIDNLNKEQFDEYAERYKNTIGWAVENGLLKAPEGNNTISAADIVKAMQQAPAWKATDDWLYSNIANQAEYLGMARGLNPDDDTKFINRWSKYGTFTKGDDGKWNYKLRDNLTDKEKEEFTNLFKRVRSDNKIGVMYNNFTDPDNDTKRYLLDEKGNPTLIIGDDVSNYTQVGNPFTWGDEPNNINKTAIFYKPKEAGDISNPEEEDYVPKLKPEAPAYFGMFGPLAALTLMGAGVGKYRPFLDNIGAPVLTNYQPVGNYMKYNPMDIWAAQNANNARSLSTDRYIRNNTGPIGAQWAGLIANGNNGTNANGELFQKVNLGNLQSMEAVLKHNNQLVDQPNATAHDRTAQYNATVLNDYNKAASQYEMQKHAMNEEARAAWNSALYENIGEAFTGLNDYFRSNAEDNLIARLAASGALGGGSPKHPLLGQYLDYNSKSKGRK